MVGKKKNKQNKPDLATAKFERYLSFKIRFIEAIQLARLRNEMRAMCKPVKGGHDCTEHLVHTIQAALYTWVAGLNDLDHRSVSVFRLWKEFFESDSATMKKLKEAEGEVEGGLNLIRSFRNSHGAHADRFDVLLGKHRALQANQSLLEKSISYFLVICEALVRQEVVIFPDFETRLEVFIRRHGLNDAFRCVARSNPTVRDATDVARSSSPYPYPAFDIMPINVMGKKMALLRIKKPEK